MKPIAGIIIVGSVCTAVGVGAVIYRRKKLIALREEEAKDRASSTTSVGEWLGGFAQQGDDFKRTYQYRVNPDPELKRFSFKVGRTEIEFDTLEDGIEWVKTLPPRNWQSRTSPKK